MPRNTQETHFLLSARDSTKVAFKGVRTNLGQVGKAVTGVHAQLLSLAGIGGFGFLVAGIVKTNQEFQTLKSSLKTVTGSTQAASVAFDQIERFAATTPFDINEVTQSFIKLKALGLDPSESALRSYGNTASAMGKSLDQMIEAVADAATGEFERLKEFGIRASKQGDEVKFTFQGVTTSVKNSADEISGYLQSIGNNQFGSAMADQMKNLGPAFSNLSAAIQGVQVKIGEAGVNDFIVGITSDMTAFINSLDEEQIEAFTRAAMNGFADVLDAAGSVYSFVDRNNLGAMGLVGYLLFGRAGVAAVAMVGWANELLGKDLAQNWDYLNPSGITGGVSNGPSGYQLGDFNSSNGNQAFLEWAKDWEQKTGGEKLAEKQGETNSILKEIADRLRDQNVVAVAG